MWEEGEGGWGKERDRRGRARGHLCTTPFNWQELEDLKYITLIILLGGGCKTEEFQCCNN